MAVTGTHFDLKIFVDKEKGRVLFAEAGGDFVDVLFSFLTLPLGTIVRLIGKAQSEPASTLGCFTTLSESVQNLGSEYFCAENLGLHKGDGIERAGSGEDRKINVKVVLKKSNKELLFVEAFQDFVDFLFRFLVIPVGEMLHLMEGQSGLGCIDGLYKSVLSLESWYCAYVDSKNNLLRPKLPPLFKRGGLLFPLEATDLSCSIDGVTRIMLKDSKALGVDHWGWFVRGGETFMVHDNLELTPFSAESVISICNKNKLSLLDVEERSLSLGIEEGISILRASLNSTCAISNGLLHNDLILKEPKEEK